MNAFWQTIRAAGAGRSVADPAAARRLAEALGQTAGARVYPESLAPFGRCVAAMARRGTVRTLLVAWPQATPPTAGEADGFEGARAEVPLDGEASVLVAGPLSPASAAALRRALPWTAPQPIAGRPSFGLGDRLGLATPGHVRAVRGTGFVPVLAQQSIREMTRCGRSPQTVIDDATWGVFQTGFRAGFAADADHLKTHDDVSRCATAGYTFYTIDPGDHVANAADDADGAALAEAFEALPWDRLESTPADTLAACAGRALALADGRARMIDATDVHRAAVKYGRAVAHTAMLARHLAGVRGRGGFELEVSVDETLAPTSPAEHAYVASELARLGVAWVSLAPRFVGRFEKGVDYLGDLGEFERHFADHAAVARALGDYKISLHSGSDKFSVYAIAARHAGRRLHVKTAGTSYLEALRVVAAHAPGLFREILAVARARYAKDRATYYVSADLARVPRPHDLADDALPALLDAFDCRQALHVTYGSVLAAEGGRLREALLEALRTHEEAYAEALHRHIGRHLAPLVETA